MRYNNILRASTAFHKASQRADTQMNKIKANRRLLQLIKITGAQKVLLIDAEEGNSTAACLSLLHPKNIHVINMNKRICNRIEKNFKVNVYTEEFSSFIKKTKIKFDGMYIDSCNHVHTLAPGIYDLFQRKLLNKNSFIMITLSSRGHVKRLNSKFKPKFSYKEWVKDDIPEFLGDSETTKKSNYLIHDWAHQFNYRLNRIIPNEDFPRSQYNNKMLMLQYLIE